MVENGERGRAYVFAYSTSGFVRSFKGLRRDDNRHQNHQETDTKELKCKSPGGDYGRSVLIWLLTSTTSPSAPMSLVGQRDRGRAVLEALPATACYGVRNEIRRS